ncbi:uncharacterized protein [Ptychodera flava]|uniref:uncharacterized protein n=1 Tax=Ptychodera flava TaxID=63121 RepID=UPI00396A8B9D
MASRSFALYTACLALAFSSVEALDCYSCIGGPSDKCTSDPASLGSNAQKSCTESDPVCYIIETTVADTKQFVDTARGCVAKTECTIGCTKEGGFQFCTTQCCEADLCNESSVRGLHSNAVTIFVGILFAIVGRRTF